MTHDLFGKLKYRDRDEQWVGYAPLARFALHAAGTPEVPINDADADRMIADMNLAIENMRDAMRQKLGDKVDAAFDQWNREVSQMQARAEEEALVEPSPEEIERARKRLARETRRADRIARGLFPIGVGTEPDAQPSAAQEASFRFLIENEAAVLDAVLAKVFESYQTYYEDERWRKASGMTPAAAAADLAGRFVLKRLDIVRESRGGFAHLVFIVDSRWQDKHGLLVVYSPDRREAGWTSWDILHDLLESDDPTDREDEYVPTPHHELVLAIREGDEEKARQLAAAGADVNALAPGEYPPLWIAVDQMEPDEVRRLLAFGADPALACEEEQSTPLKHAKRLYRELGFEPSKKRDGFAESILSMTRAANPEQFAQMQSRLEEIIGLLRGAKDGLGEPGA